MNGAILREYLPLYTNALLVTLQISVYGIFFATLFGAICSFIQYYKVPVIRKIVGAYIELSRNTPVLVQLFFIYFGLPKIGIRFSGITSSVIAITFLGGSYMAETFRSGLDAVDKIQQETAISLGMNKYQMMRYVIFPQAFAISVPSFFANVIFLVKETSVVSGIAVADLMYVAKDLIGNDYNTSEALFMLVIFYLIILLPTSLLGTYVEKRVRYAAAGN